MKLVIGEEYEVLDWHGMHSYKGIYRGTAHNGVPGSTQVGDPHSLLVLEKMDGGYKFCGCEPRARINHEGEMVPYLFATHFGNSVEDLTRVARSYARPKWVLENKPL